MSDEFVKASEDIIKSGFFIARTEQPNSYQLRATTLWNNVLQVFENMNYHDAVLSAARYLSVFNNQKDIDYLREAYKIAQLSKDPSTQNGVIIVSDRLIIGSGYNKFPSGVADDERWNNKALKYKTVVHAETASILDAAKRGYSTSGTTMYGCWVACVDCARDIIEAGITEVVGHHHPAMDDRPDWNVGIQEAFSLLREAGVKVRTVDGTIGTALRFAGKESLV